MISRIMSMAAMGLMFVASSAMAQDKPDANVPQGAPPEHHDGMRERMKERYENASPEEKAKMDARRAEMKEKWQNATPEQKEEMRKKFKERRQERREERGEHPQGAPQNPPAAPAQAPAGAH